MSNIVFYRDTADTFECDVNIKGASTSETKSRLVLEFSDRTLLFTGQIIDGHISINIPKLSEISDEQGTATLEVIADQTYFEAWTSSFELKNKKSIEIAEVKINANVSRVVVENVSKNVVEEEAPKTDGTIYRESCSKKNRKFVVESFGRFKALDKSERKEVKNTLKEFTAKAPVKKWAETIFNDVDTPYAKYCMYEVQKGLFG